MPESTLSLTFAQLKSQTGVFLGWGSGATPDRAWTTRESNLLDQFVASGLRRFYRPEPLVPGGTPHQWSFLEPVAVLTLEAGNQFLNLPDDFGMGVGQIYPALDGQTFVPLRWVDSGIVQRAFAASPAQTGRPVMLAQIPRKGTTAARGQRFEAQVFPTPDAAYELTVTYSITPDCINGLHPYAYGGSAHAETIREAILSTAERDLDNVSDGPHSRAYKERLAASLAFDGANRPQHMGYNRDRSDAPNWPQGARRWPWGWPDGGVTVNGTQY